MTEPQWRKLENDLMISPTKPPEKPEIQPAAGLSDAAKIDIREPEQAKDVPEIQKPKPKPKPRRAPIGGFGSNEWRSRL